MCADIAERCVEALEQSYGNAQGSNDVSIEHELRDPQPGYPSAAHAGVAPAVSVVKKRAVKHHKDQEIRERRRGMQQCTYNSSCCDPVAIKPDGSPFMRCEEHKYKAAAKRSCQRAAKVTNNNNQT